jgi:hypothetical protein
MGNLPIARFVHQAHSQCQHGVDGDWYVDTALGSKNLFLDAHGLSGGVRAPEKMLISLLSGEK